MFENPKVSEIWCFVQFSDLKKRLDQVQKIRKFRIFENCKQDFALFLNFHYYYLLIVRKRISMEIMESHQNKMKRLFTKKYIFVHVKYVEFQIITPLKLSWFNKCYLLVVNNF